MPEDRNWSVGYECDCGVWVTAPLHKCPIRASSLRVSRLDDDGNPVGLPVSVADNGIVASFTINTSVDPELVRLLNADPVPMPYYERHYIDPDEVRRDLGLPALGADPHAWWANLVDPDYDDSYLLAMEPNQLDEREWLARQRAERQTEEWKRPQPKPDPCSILDADDPWV